MNLRSLETLVEIDARGSFLKTAERLNMTLSTVSMQMKGLEEELGVALFDRTFRPPKLTPMGRRVADEARRVSVACDHLLSACRVSGVLSGNFRIGFVLTSSIRLLPDFLMRARHRAPQASFIVETGLSDDLISRVGAGVLDAAVVTAANIPRSIDFHVLTREEMVYCMPPIARDWTIERCMKDLPFIHFMPQTGIGRLIAQHLLQNDLKPRNVIMLDSVEAVAECVRAGVGFAILPEPDIRRNAGDTAILRSLSDKLVMRELVLIYQVNAVIAQNASLLAALFSEDL